jgi:ATP-binding cassette subfamily C (CFTR/MRP) protein 1
MIEKVGNAPINKYFDITPIGRVLNKFSSDLNDLSMMFGMLYGAELSMFYSLTQVVIVAAIALIYFTFIFPLLIIVSFYIYG